MSVNKKSDEPAFPQLKNDILMGLVQNWGVLTKREYFAGLAMQGMCGLNVYKDITKHELAEKIAIEAVIRADALLAELEKE